jgi:hypothetical protein
MFNEIQHQYSEHKNKELAWLIIDYEITYENNLKNNKEQLEKYNWIDNQFTYKFNRHGFRSEEFTDDDSIMFFGCSNTVGIGLPVENTWAYQVAKKLDLKCFNLAIGATGPDTAFRLANHYIPQIKPKIVVYAEPHPTRFSLFSIDDVYQFSTHNIISLKHGETKKFESFYEHWVLNDENIKLNSLKHKLAIQALCQQHNIKFVFAESYSELYCGIDLARDLMHAGVKSNKIFAELILSRIDQSN